MKPGMNRGQCGSGGKEEVEDDCVRKVEVVVCEGGMGVEENCHEQGG